MRKKSKKKKDMNTRVGTAYYVSPEVLKGNYDEKCDIWSAGVILYILLCGDPPFNGEDDNAIYRAISKKKYDFPDSQWKNISKEAKDLIKHMMCDPDKRYNAKQVLDDPWVVKEAPNAKDALKDLNVLTLKKYRNEHKLKKAVLTFIASRLNDEEVKHLNAIFENLDENKDGTLTLNEVKKGIEKLDKKEFSGDVEDIFKSLDTDSSGRIDYTEFLAACINQKSFLRQERLNEAFQMLDKDGSGKITKDEIKKALKLDKVDEEVLNQLIQKYDLNGDGMIDYNEFLNMMNDV
jgi:calcium-dependent protein kinase